jgi:hypothetical protein
MTATAPAAHPTGLLLPSPFPDDVFEAVKERIFSKVPSASQTWEQLAGSHNGVRYRLRACADYSEEFTQSVQRFGDSPPADKRYRQERQLFGFFVSGYAALDSFCFFIYFAAVHVQPGHFPTQLPGHIKSIGCKSTPAAFARAFPGEDISAALDALINHSTFKDWDGYRNILAHRAAPGRVMYASIGSSTPDPAADWKIGPAGGLKIDASLTPPRLAWLVHTLSGLVVAADTFTRKHV